MNDLERLVKEWRDAQKAIDRMPVRERQKNREPLERMIAAHVALLEYADEKLG